MTTGTRLALVGDIGGTHARFAISDVDEMTVTHFAALQTRLFASLQDALAAYLGSVPFRPDMVGLAVAAPVAGGAAAMTNASWSFTRGDVEAVTGASRVVLINDFEALARVAPYLVAHDLEPLGGGTRDPEAPRIVLGAGTGFGAASLVKSGRDWAAIAGEGGHASFGATDDEELAVRKHLSGTDDHVSIERVLSGRGLEAVYAVLGLGARKVPAPEIVTRAEARSDPLAERTLALFTTVLARVAGDMALTLGARGGVYLAGGIAPKIGWALHSQFRDAFERKGRMSDYLSAVPVDVVKAPDAGLRGAALATSEAFPPATSAPAKGVTAAA